MGFIDQLITGGAHYRDIIVAEMCWQSETKELTETVSRIQLGITHKYAENMNPKIRSLGISQSFSINMM